MQLALEDWQQFNFRLNAYLAKYSFGSGVRLDFYRSLMLLISNQVRLNEALNELHRVYSNDGQQPYQPVAMVIQDCIDSMNEGLPFTEALSRWVPMEEGMLLQAGEASGKLDEAFADAERIMIAQKQIIGAIAGAVAYPLVLFLLTGFLLNMIATELVPKLAQVVDPAKWTGPAAMLYHLANYVQHYGPLTVIVLLVIVVASLSSLSWFGTPLRIWLDRIPPWSIYRMVHGATFLLNISALIKSGMRLNMALNKLLEHANPWLRTRLEAVAEELAAGKNFGEALSDTGYHFPDKKANRFLAVIAAYSGLDVAMAKFGNSWLEDTVAYIQRIAKLILVFGVLAVGVTMLLVIAGAGGLQDAVQSSVGQ
ncbi:type II secretion system F family protein [unidentified bacterial endosymbiont]|uniref:type II secretion system F family protein n=1 Tax=unidentified bacterial endosymbiont TaxID=2355 RepID=UPI00209D5C90|nr:type II secretion system F family protein [unidentified bacterial endosymbiont]